MKRIYLIILGCIATSMLQAQELSGQYTTEWQWDMNKNTNWVNQLRLDLSVPLGSDRNTRSTSPRPAKASLVTGRDSPTSMPTTCWHPLPS